MDRRSKAYLTKAAQPGGFTDRVATDWATAQGLKQKGLVILTEVAAARKGVGVFPAPHTVATDAGRTVLAALGR